MTEKYERFFEFVAACGIILMLVGAIGVIGAIWVVGEDCVTLSEFHNCRPTNITGFDEICTITVQNNCGVPVMVRLELNTQGKTK